MTKNPKQTPEELLKNIAYMNELFRSPPEETEGAGSITLPASPIYFPSSSHTKGDVFDMGSGSHVTPDLIDYTWDDVNRIHLTRDGITPLTHTGGTTIKTYPDPDQGKIVKEQFGPFGDWVVIE